MIILALLIGALCLYGGYQWGKGVGQTELERKIVNHVLNSPEYSSHVYDAIKKSFRKVK